MSITVTAVFNGSPAGSNLKVVVLTGATEAGGAQVAGSNTGGAPNWSLTPNGSNSLPLFEVYDQTNGGSGTYTASSNNTLLDNSVQHDAFCDGYYSGTVTSGTGITLGCSAPTGTDKQVWASYEVKSSGSSTPTQDASTPAVVAQSSSNTCTTAAFTPPAGAVLVALCAGNNANAAPTVSDSSGLTWTQRSSQSAGGGTASVFTATVAGGGTGSDVLDEANYIISVSGGTVTATTVSTATVLTSGTDGGAVLTACLNAIGSGPGTVAFQAGSYPWSTTPQFSRNYSGWVKIIAEPGTTISLSNSAKSFLSFNKVASGDTFKYIHVEGFTVDCGSLTQNSSQHVIIGTWTTAGIITDINFDHITVRRCRVINAFAGATATAQNLGIWLQVYQDASGLALTCNNILIEECEFNGGNYGVLVGGQKTGTWTGNTNITGDNIRIRDIKHDVGNDPPLAFDTYAHVQVGSDLVATTVWIERVWGRGSRDVGIEVDNLTDCHVRDCHFHNCHGFTCLVTGFDPVSDVNNQSYDFEDITLVRDAGSWDSSAAALIGVRHGTDHNSADTPIGRVRARNLRMYVTASSLNDIVTDGVSGDLVNVIGSVKELIVENAGYYANGYQQTNTTTQSFPSVVYIAGTPSNLTYSKVTLRDIDIFFNAVNNTGAAACVPDLIQLSGTLGFTVENVSVNMSVTNPTTNAQTVMNFGTASGTTTANGTIRRLKVLGQNDTSGTGVNVKGSSTVTIPNAIVVADCDFSGMSASLSAGRELQVGDATNAAKVFSYHNKWVTQPKVPYTLTTPSSGTATQYHEMWDSLLQIAGGTVTNVSVGKSSGSLFQVASGTNVAVPICNGDWFSVTYSVSPTVRVIPVT